MTRRAGTATRRPGPLDALAIPLGSFAGCGFFPWAPATFASAVATPLLAWAYPFPEPLQYPMFVLLILFVGTWAAGRMERLWGHDPSAVVVDEVLGMSIALAYAPIGFVTCVLGFALFRAFDVLKPWPVRALERLPGGWGVMADDAGAGLYACLVLQLVLRVWPAPRFAPWMLVPLGAAAALLVVFRKPLLARYGKPRSDPRAGLGSGAET